MADILSQSEIDNLLSALSSGELEAEELQQQEERQKVKLYDFRSPQKFSKDHIRTLELLHNTFSRTCSNYLTGITRQNTKLKLVTLEQITYEEFIRSVPNPTILVNFKFMPLNGVLTFEFNPGFVFQIIDILLGGQGERRYVAKDFTEIDKNIIEKVAKEVIQNLKRAWDEVIEVSPEYDGMEVNPALNQTLAPNEPIALVTFSVEMGSNTSMINLCIPYMSIEHILDKLILNHWSENDEEEFKEEYKTEIKKHLNSAPIDINVELGRSTIMINDFLKLAKGDVLRLDNLISDPVKIFIEDKACYYGKPGVVSKNKGVEILDMIKEEGNDNG